MGCSSSSPVGPAPPIGTLRSLQAATRGGPAALRKHFADVPFPAQPGLDAWAAALADAQAEGWARAVVAAVDALWTPLVAAVEKKLSDPEVSASYDALTPRLLRLFGTVANVAFGPVWLSGWRRRWPSRIGCPNPLLARDAGRRHEHTRARNEENESSHESG